MGEQPKEPWFRGVYVGEKGKCACRIERPKGGWIVILRVGDEG